MNDDRTTGASEGESGHAEELPPTKVSNTHTHMPNDMAAETERLRSRVVELERECDMYRIKAQVLERDYKELHSAYWKVMRKQLTEEEMRELAAVPDLANCVPFDQVLAELEQSMERE